MLLGTDKSFHARTDKSFHARTDYPAVGTEGKAQVKSAHIINTNFLNESFAVGAR
jgi:hypothetical protein